MAMNSYSPTAANILASLKVRGASVTGGEGKGGYVPVLDQNGKIDVSVIPEGTIESLVQIPPLPDVAFVDLGSTVPSDRATGSIAAPFKTLQQAASDSRRYQNFLLTGGNFGDVTLTINNTSEKPKVRIFSLGSSVFANLTFDGYANGTVFEFYNISVATVLRFANNTSCTVAMFGNCSVAQIQATDEDGHVDVFVDPSVTVTSTTGSNITVRNLAAGKRIANDSSKVAGGTVTDALDRLHDRQVRIPVFTGDATGLHADTHRDVPNDEGINAYSLLTLGAELVAAINGVFHKDNDSPTYDTVTATKVAAATVVTPAAVVQKVKFGVEGDVKAVVEVDSDGFLVVVQDTQDEQDEQNEQNEEE
jgi:hypothetical protein